MATNRLNRINEDIQRELSVLIPRVKDPRVQQGMVTVTGVETTPDLRYAKVYLSILGEVNEKELRRGLRSAGPWLRRELGGSLTLRYTPELIFERDRSIENGARLTKLIDDVMASEARSEDGAEEEEHDAE
jgi:ribosome-binding factor A